MVSDGTAGRLLAHISTVIDGKEEVVEAAIVVLLAEGHLLIEDVPGTGKTVLARAIAKSVDCTSRRIQFTPDLLPSDIIGVSVFHQDTSEFEFRPGPVFANVVVADEINRGLPKSQAALLEAMEERRVTIDGDAYELARPFMVVATQNPHEMEGTYPLPEAEIDRFTARISMGYPSPDAELAMLRDRRHVDPIETLAAVVSVDEVRAMIDAAKAVHIAESVETYVVALVSATRNHEDLRLGASPRASLQLVRSAKARAYLHGRSFVVPDDVASLAPMVLQHRLVPHYGAAPAEKVLEQILHTVPVPGATTYAYR